MRTLRTIAVLATIGHGCFGVGAALASSFYAEAYSAVSGHPIDFQSESSTSIGANARSGLTALAPTAYGLVSSSASIHPGTLRVTTSASSGGSTGANGSARADWADSFIIGAAGYNASETGTFSGSVSIDGLLRAGFEGRGTGISSVLANIRIDPSTGYNGGRVDLQGGGRRIAGYELGFRFDGLEQFTLNFVDVPFTFGRGIDVYLRLEATSSATTGDGAAADAQALYGHSMTWQGLTSVRDSTGVVLSQFSAISPGSGFDFSSPVPEPNRLALLMAGALWVLFRARRIKASFPSD